MAQWDIRVSSRRDQLTIMSDLLEIIQQPQRLTHILYKSNMSYGQLSKYLSEMQEMGLVETRMSPYRCFIITPKGIQFSKMLESKKRVKKLEE